MSGPEKTRHHKESALRALIGHTPLLHTRRDVSRMEGRHSPVREEFTSPQKMETRSWPENEWGGHSTCSTSSHAPIWRASSLSLVHHPSHQAWRHGIGDSRTSARKRSSRWQEAASLKDWNSPAPKCHLNHVQAVNTANINGSFSHWPQEGNLFWPADPF